MDITKDNVSHLSKAWVTSIADDGEQEASPIVWHGTMYLSTPHDNVLALDAKTGALKWAFPYSPAYELQYAVNRGVGLADGKVFIVTADCRLIALDAATGKQVYNVPACRDTSNTWYSTAAYVYKDTVVVGTSGGDLGSMGTVNGFNAGDGAKKWTFNTVPQPGEANHNTWPGDSWKHGGAAVWAGLSIDPATDTLYLAPGNAGPNLTLAGRKGKDLYSDSVVAVDISGASPKIKWYYQILTNDTHDADPSMPPVLFDAQINGQTRNLLASGDKAGDFVVLDRTSGKLVYRTSVSNQTGIMTTVPTLKGTFACPNHGGGIEWNGGSYDPAANVFIIPSTQECAVWKVTSTGPVAYVAGQPYSAGPLPKRRAATGFVTAMDMNTGKVKWRNALPYSGQGGVLVAKNGIAFTSDARGRVYALDTATGKELWHGDTGSAVVAPISAYRVEGNEYLALVAAKAAISRRPTCRSRKEAASSHSR
ncbi:MAG: PQQ-binding-like beta-propeller repeat protein [Candidatus Eremiobacteraeota bacterium]|nr:PQQ-binding-like beta-propeller repeat protein [Candidatus Eremiobacteraeota bacterium]